MLDCWIACKENNYDLFLKLHTEGSHVCDLCVYYSIINDNVRCIEYLLKNSTLISDKTLISAIFYNRIQTVKFLLKYIRVSNIILRLAYIESEKVYSKLVLKSLNRFDIETFKIVLTYGCIKDIKYIIFKFGEKRVIEKYSNVLLRLLNDRHEYVQSIINDYLNNRSVYKEYCWLRSFLILVRIKKVKNI